MGNACCIVARDKTIVNGSSSDVMHRNIRHSPTWSFRWDNRVAGEETSINCLADEVSQNGGYRTKYESVYASEEGSPVNNMHRGSLQKSPLSEGTAGHVRTPASDRSISRNISLDMNSEQVKESIESPAPSHSHPSPTKTSLSPPSTSSLTASPLSSQSQLYHASSIPSRQVTQSPGHQLLQQVSDGRVPGTKSPSGDSISEERPVLLPWNNESTRASRGGSSDGWSMNAFSELMATSHKERWSFESESFGLNHGKLTRSSSRISSSSSADTQSCRVCSKFLTEKSSWSSQKIFAGNELAVVAVLICGHAYHAECLERMTSEANKYDPACPVCTLGEKQTLKLFEKALKAEMVLKARNNKRSRNRIVDNDASSDFIELDRMKTIGREYKGAKMGSSSSMKSSTSKPPFLRRHFSFGSKGRSLLENHSNKKKSFFWGKSSNE